MKKTVFAAVALTTLLSGCAAMNDPNNHCGGCGDYSQQNIQNVRNVCEVASIGASMAYDDAVYYHEFVRTGDPKQVAFSRAEQIESAKSVIAQDKENGVDVTLYDINYAFDQATSADDAEQTAYNHCMDQYFPQYVNGAGSNWGLGD